jgi:hypothetical protein
VSLTPTSPGGGTSSLPYGTVTAALTGATQTSRYVGATVSGAPTAGTFSVGDFVIDRAGGAWVCSVAGTPGTWGPAVAAGSVQNVHIAPGASIAASKIQGGSAATSGGLFLLSTTTLAADGIVDVTGISQAYSDLVIVGVVRSTFAGGNDPLSLRMNGDNAGHYNYQLFYSGSTTVTAGASVLSTAIRLVEAIVASTGTVGRFTAFEAQLCGYSSTTWHKAAFCAWSSAQSDVAAVQLLGSDGGVWASTAAISQVTLFPESGANLLSGSQVRVYGRP